jgi:hypothetical protein
LLLFEVNSMANLLRKLLGLVLADDLEFLDDVDGDGAEVAADQGHAALLIARDEQGAAAAEAVAIVLTRHAVTPVNSAEHVAGKLGRSSSGHWRLLRCLGHHVQGLGCSLKVLLGIDHLVDRVEGPRAVVADKHCGTAVVVLGEDL